MKKIILSSVLIASLATAAIAGMKPPTETQGVSPEVTHVNDLSAQIPAMAAYQLRGRKITFAPGATFTKHSHASRPGIVYVMSGEVVVVDNGVKEIYSAGDTWIETAETDHWLANKSDKPASIWMVDLPEKK